MLLTRNFVVEILQKVEILRLLVRLPLPFFSLVIAAVQNLVDKFQSND
ncbi:hypothetical protein H6F98_14120 [Microcoleus sp. FACHB-SPT15]|nr:hypothetical protein [Microcoleus sp. FACHB-SPT15]MBD1806584.1 hypothetical protein [Microcoleus sp. FACHB-SPT15]